MKRRTCLLLLFSIFVFSFECHSRDNRALCFKCHTEFTLEEYNFSIHRQFSCSVCHRDIDLKAHLKETKEKREVWRSKLNAECLGCHDIKILTQKVHHSGVIRNNILCSECHDPHRTKSVKLEKRRKRERDYCLGCHGKKGLTMKFKDGEEISLYVDEKSFLKSAHGDKSCTFCHNEFSYEKHPRRIYENRRAFVSELSPKACERCHKEQCKRYERCVHGGVSKAKGRAPLCSDCHKPHYVRIEKDDIDLNLFKCVECHREVYGAYRESVHFKAREKGVKKAPLCTGCHRPHDVLITSFNIRNTEVCFECHKGVEKIHAKWFYNPPFKSSSFVKFHLDSITCNVCHAKEKEGAVYLHPYDKKTKTPITIERMEHLLGITKDKIATYLDANKDGYLGASELWGLFRDLAGRNVRLTFYGWMDVRNPVLSHWTLPKEEALRKCEICHRADSPFFKDAFIVIRDEYGWPTIFFAGKDVLSTRSALSPLSEFYVFGSTRIALVDFLLIVALIGAILVPTTHITLRILTRKWRKRRM